VKIGEVFFGEIHWIGVEDDMLQVLVVVCANTNPFLPYGFGPGHLRPDARPA
jgi:hypothetical protein